MLTVVILKAVAPKVANTILDAVYKLARLRLFEKITFKINALAYTCNGWCHLVGMKPNDHSTKNNLQLSALV